MRERKYYGGLESLTRNNLVEELPAREIPAMSFRDALRSTKYSILAKLMLPFVWVYLRVKRAYYGPVNLSDRWNNLQVLLHMQLAGVISAQELIRYETSMYISYSTLQKFLKYRKENKHLADVTTLPNYPKPYAYDPATTIQFKLSDEVKAREPSEHSLKSRQNIKKFGRYGDARLAKVQGPKLEKAEEDYPVKCPPTTAFINEGDIPMPNHENPAVSPLQSLFTEDQ